MIGFIVDGQGDFAALRERFPSHRVLKTDGPRGHEVSIQQIVARSRKQVAILNGFRCTKVVVVTDLERRPVRYDDFVEELGSELARAHKACVVIASVPNRMIENWYLADISYLATKKVFLKKLRRQRSFEGQDGKVMLRRQFKDGYAYNEVVHGRILFGLVRFEAARLFSQSLDQFLRSIEVEGEAGSG